MKKTTFAIIIYMLGLLFGAFILEVWSAETSAIKSAIVLIWTIIFLIVLFYADKIERK
jgi:hypothetical protein|tara:strand:- start:80 stop:253 length:174 start_codon:yes stop_codon:yes gene_type:complete